jgi:hypothetical protein
VAAEGAAARCGTRLGTKRPPTFELREARAALRCSGKGPLSALRDDEPYRNPRVVQDYGMESDEEANSKATPPPRSVDGGVWVDDDARGGQF